MGTVFLVVLRSTGTGRYKDIYACKIVSERFLTGKNEEIRRKNLQREIKLLRQTAGLTDQTQIAGTTWSNLRESAMGDAYQ